MVTVWHPATAGSVGASVSWLPSAHLKQWARHPIRTAAGALVGSATRRQGKQVGVSQSQEDKRAGTIKEKVEKEHERCVYAREGSHGQQGTSCIRACFCLK